MRAGAARLTALTLLALLPACGEFADGVRSCGGEPCGAARDGAVGDPTDAGFLPGLDAAPPAASDSGAAIDGGSMGLAESSDPDACLDGFDNDDFGGADCDDTSCSTSPACCVGSSVEPCCGDMSEVATLDVASCSVGPAASCAAIGDAGTLYGGTLPRIESGGFVAGGDDMREGGLVIEAGVEPSVARVAITARIAAGAGCERCLDGLFVSLARGSDGAARVEPVVGLLVSGTRGDASLVVGGTSVAREALPDEGEHTYTLAVEPDGRVTLTSDFGLSMSGTASLPGGPLDVVVHGTSSNRGASDPPPARLVSLSVQARACDLPQALGRMREAITSDPRFGDTSWAPSIARVPGTSGPEGLRVAFVGQGGVWIARGHTDGSFSIAGSSAALATPSWAQGGLGDPELVALESESRWLLLVTARALDGTSRVMAVPGADDWGESFATDDATTILEAQDDPHGGARFVSFDGASVLATGSAMAEWLLVARAIRESGTTELVLARLGGSGSWELSDVCGTGGLCPDLSSGEQRTVHAPRHDVGSAFDHDEVAAPALTYNHGVYRLYYAGRRGTRWSIGVLLSTDLRTFAPALDGVPVLGGSGEGYRALGARDPSILMEDGRIWLWHTGLDGERARVGSASQLAR